MQDYSTRISPCNGFRYVSTSKPARDGSTNRTLQTSHHTGIHYKFRRRSFFSNNIRRECRSWICHASRYGLDIHSTVFGFSNNHSLRWIIGRILVQKLNCCIPISSQAICFQRLGAYAVLLRICRSSWMSGTGLQERKCDDI